MSLLSIDALSVGIRGTPILDSVSLDVGAGEVLGVAGVSGSGKTMTALAVAGLLPVHDVEAVVEAVGALERASAVGHEVLDAVVAEDRELLQELELSLHAKPVPPAPMSTAMSRREMLLQRLEEVFGLN